VAAVHDADGNLTALGSLTFEYDARNRFTQGSFEGTAVAYERDPRGLRVGRSENSISTRFVLDPAGSLPRRLVETDGSGAPLAFYVQGLGPIARIGAQSFEAIYYHYDPVGNVIGGSRNDGAVAARYAYSAFGAPNLRLGDYSNPYSTGGLFGITDEGRGVAYCHARLYLPSEGRFSARDPIDSVSGAASSYPYSGNDPVNFVDPTGQFAQPLTQVALPNSSGGAGTIAPGGYAGTLFETPYHHYDPHYHHYGICKVLEAALSDRRHECEGSWVSENLSERLGLFHLLNAFHCYGSPILDTPLSNRG
jgi:RHS repeat-associated protein